MGIKIVRVPKDFAHPLDEDGEYVPGAHFELLCDKPEDELQDYQIYENVSEGTPISPILSSLEELQSWLHEQGYSDDKIDFLVTQGHAPLLIVDVQKE